MLEEQMFGSNVLEVAIGIIFVYLLLSLMCTALNEGIASLLDKRSSNLFEGIKNLLNDPKFTGLAQQLYNHGLIAGTSQYAADPGKMTRKPSYMSPANFSLALLDILGARGIIANKYGDLLARAEKADDDYEEACVAAARAPRVAAIVAAQAQAKVASDEARAGLEAVVDQVKTAYDQARQAANGAPGDASLAVVAAKARNDAEIADAALRMLDARRAAIDCARNSKEAALFVKASVTLKEALGFVRAFAAEYPDPLKNIQEGLKKLPDGDTKETLLVLIDKTRREVTSVEHQAEAFRRNLEGWFNHAMERVSGWYKRWTQRVLLCLAIIVVVISNADTLMLIEWLSKDDTLRASLAAAAQEAVKTPISSNAGAVDLQQVLRSTENVPLPIGWSLKPDDPRHFKLLEFEWSLKFAGWAFYKIFGLMISILAVSLGAPFWFDTLSKFVNVRSAGAPPGEIRKSAPQPGS
jgi:hypothetical protein